MALVSPNPVGLQQHSTGKPPRQPSRQLTKPRLPPDNIFGAMFSSHHYPALELRMVNVALLSRSSTIQQSQGCPLPMNGSIPSSSERTTCLTERLRRWSVNGATTVRKQFANISTVDGSWEAETACKVLQISLDLYNSSMKWVEQAKHSSQQQSPAAT